MFSKKGSYETEIEQFLTEKLSPSLDLLNATDNLETLNQVASKFEELGLEKAAEYTTALIEKLAEVENQETTEAKLARLDALLRKSFEEMQTMDWTGYDLKEVENLLHGRVLRGIKQAIMGLELLKKLGKQNLMGAYEQEEGPATTKNPEAAEAYEGEEGPATVRSAEEYWAEELTKAATNPFYTVKFPAGTVKDIVSDALQFAGVTNKNYFYHRDGSTVKFSPKELNEFMSYLKDALKTDYLKEEHPAIKNILDHTRNAMAVDPNIAQASLKLAAKKKPAKTKKTTKTKAKTKTKAPKKKEKAPTSEEQVENLETWGWPFNSPDYYGQEMPENIDEFLKSDENSCGMGEMMADDANSCGEEYNMMMADDMNWVSNRDPICSECGFHHAPGKPEPRHGPHSLPHEKHLNKQRRHYWGHPVEFSELDRETGEIEGLDPEFDEIGFGPKLKNEVDDYNWIDDENWLNYRHQRDFGTT